MNKQELNKKGIWVTRDGYQIPLSDVPTMHLINITRLLIRAANRYAAQLMAFYVSCPEPNGDMAQLAFDTALSYIMENEDEVALGWLRKQPIYPWIKKEFISRSLVTSFEDEVEIIFSQPDSIDILNKLS